MSNLEAFYGPNAGYVLELYERYGENPESVDPATRAVFDRWKQEGELPKATTEAQAESAAGQRQLIESLKRCLREPIFDREIRQLLEQATQDPTRYSALLRRLLSQIHAASTTILYPNQPPSLQPLEDCYRPKRERGDDNHFGWRRLISDAGQIALKLVEIEDQEGKWYRAYFVVLALRLMLLARLYDIRAEINENVVGKEPVKNAFEQPQVVVQKFLEKCSDYHAQIREWGLYEVLPPGWKESGDSTAYNAWSRDFGRASDTEIYWSLFARDIGTELRYQSRRMQLKHLWSKVRYTGPDVQVPAHFLSALPLPESYRKNIYIGIQKSKPFLQALGLWIFKVIAGFGLKPARFVGTVIGTIIFFSLFYFIDDAWARCNHVTWSLGAYLQEIYYAIGNFTSVGTNPGGPCGPRTDVLISIETLMGYFLLSLLAAMLVARIIDR